MARKMAPLGQKILQHSKPYISHSQNSSTPLHRSHCYKVYLTDCFDDLVIQLKEPYDSKKILMTDRGSLVSEILGLYLSNKQKYTFVFTNFDSSKIGNHYHKLINHLRFACKSKKNALHNWI